MGRSKSSSSRGRRSNGRTVVALLYESQVAEDVRVSVYGEGCQVPVWGGEENRWQGYTHR